MANFLKSNSAKAVLGLVAFAFAFTGAGVANAYTFTAPTLKVGSRGVQVMELQKALNMCADTSITTGAGSAGYETSYFGGKTKTVVMVWQAKVGGLSVDGVFGPMSRAKMNAVGCGTGGVVVPPPSQTGPVSAMLSTTNPASSTLVAGQATADLAHIAFTGTGTVTNVTLQRIGVSADSTPSNVYLFDGATRLVDASSVSNNGMITFNVPAGIFTVNGSKTISVKSDIAYGTSGQTVGVKLVSFSTPSGTISSTVSGNIHTIASAALAAVTLSGTVTPSGATINPGTGVTLWQATFNVSQRDVWMKRIALRNVGSAPASSFQNFKLYVNGVQVGSALGMDAMGYVTFDLASMPVSLVAGSRVVRVDADVVSGASRTVQLALRQAADIDLVDSSFGVNITPAMLNGSASGTALPWTGTTASTISGTTGGTLTIEKDVTSPSSNATLNGNDVNFGTFKMTAYGEAIKVENLRVTFTASNGSVGSLRNGRLLINGVQYGSSTTLNEDSQSPAYTQFTTNYTIMPGTSVMVEVRADAYDNEGTNDLVANDTITAKIAAGSSNAMKIDSLGSLSVPSSAVSANTITVKSAALTLSRNNTYAASQNTTLPATNFKIGAYNLAGSSVEDVLLTTLSFDIDEVTNATFTESDITNMYVVVKDANGSTVAQTSPIATLSSDGQDNNFSINYTLVKNTNVSIELYANLGSTVTVADSFRTDLTVTGTSLVGGASVTATSADTQGQTIIYGAASITATVDSSTPVAGIVYDNQTVETAAFKFAAVTSGYNVTDVTLTLGSNATTVASNVMLYDGATLLATQPSATTVTFSGLNWNVPANMNKVLSVKLQLGSVGVGAGTSGSALTTTMTSFTATSTSTGVSAAGTESDPAGNGLYAFASIPVITQQALANNILSNVSSKPLLKFKVDAMGGPIGWNEFTFDVVKDAATTVGTNATTGITLWDVTNGGNTSIAGTFTNAATVYGAGNGAIKFVPTVEQQVSSSKVYELRGNIAAADASGDFVTVTIANDATTWSAGLDTYANILTGDSDAPIIWSDLSASGHATTTADWTSDFGVKNLPVSDSLNF
ncbi:MAG: hypothetical protein KBC67_02190 [Candidatus Pacebacteria bacterium]|nr:hypothetical protein [Candidatus Paceibacterota bacterium]